jgi:hypothetical protein
MDKLDVQVDKEKLPSGCSHDRIFSSLHVQAIGTGAADDTGDPRKLTSASLGETNCEREMAMSRKFWLVLVPATMGCSLNYSYSHRNPAFTQPMAPEPTVATETVSCLSTGIPSGTGATTSAQFETMLRSTLKARRVPLRPSDAPVVCATLSKSEMFSNNAAYVRIDWNMGPSMIAVVRDVASSHNAKSVLVPVMRSLTSCKQDQIKVTDSAGMPVRTIDMGTETCHESSRTDVGLFILTDEGVLLYKSIGLLGMSGSQPADQIIAAVLKDIPAVLQEPSGGTEAGRGPVAMAEPVAGPAPARSDPATDGKQIDELLAGLKKVPKDCRSYAEKACRNPRVQPQIRMQYCKAQIDVVRNVASSARGAEACKSMLDSSVDN